MKTIKDLQDKAAEIAGRFEVNSISPVDVGGLIGDTVYYMAGMERNLANVGIRKVYSSFSEMEQDETPLDFKGNPIRFGQLVCVYSEINGEGKTQVFSYKNPGWELVGVLAGPIGYTFAGVATPETIPGLLGGSVFYIASTPGVYPNFGNVEVSLNEVAAFVGNRDSWTKHVIGAANVEHVCRVYGEKPLVFDFTTGSIAQYANRRVPYATTSGHKYRITVLTEDTTATTYFSTRTADGNAILNDLSKTTGSRTVEFVSPGDAEFIYMSIEANGVAIVYNATIEDLTALSVKSNARKIEGVKDTINALESRVGNPIPSSSDFTQGVKLEYEGNIGTRSEYCATEDYFKLPSGLELSVSGYGFSGFPFVVVYNEDKTVKEIFNAVGSTSLKTVNLQYEETVYYRISTVYALLADLEISSVSETISKKIEALEDKQRIAEAEVEVLKGLSTDVEALKKTTDSIIGGKPLVFDFTTGSIAQYANRRVPYVTTSGHKYRITVLTNDATATTYFSTRNANGDAILNNISKTKGPRTVEFTAPGDAEFIYMSIEANGVAIAYDVAIEDLTALSLKSLSKDVDRIQTTTSELEAAVMFDTPVSSDFTQGVRVDTEGNITTRSEYCATEDYFKLPAGVELIISGYGYGDYTLVAVYNEDKTLKETYKTEGSTVLKTVTLQYEETVYYRISTVYALLADLSINSNVQSLSATIKRVEEGQQAAQKTLGAPICYSYDDFEMGSLTMTASGWSYGSISESYTRVRMKSGITYHLCEGDKLEIADGFRVYLGGRNEDGSYFVTGWKTRSYTIEQEADYKILISKVTEETTDNKLSLLTSLKIIGGVRNTVALPKFSAKDFSTMRVINHRGFNTEAPENTIPAILKSKQRGFEYVEIDVHFSSDGVPVIIHDTTVDRTSNGTGAVSELTLSALKALDFGSWFSPKYAGVTIPTLEEAIVACKELGLKIYLEIKDATHEQLDIILDTVALYGMSKHVTVICFTMSVLEYIADTNKNMRLGLLSDTYSGAFLDNLKTLKNKGCEVFANLVGSAVTDDVLRNIRKENIDVEAWTCNYYGSPVMPKLDGVTTDKLCPWDYTGDRPVWLQNNSIWNDY